MPLLKHGKLAEGVQLFLEDGAPTWPNGFDLCPDWLRSEIEAMGGLARDATLSAD